jgi:hypothetical protein
VLKIYGDEPYAMDVMEGVLEFLESKLKSGKIICPVAIYDELKKREKSVDGLKDWLKEYKHCFLDLSTDQISVMAPIVNKYDVYASDKGDYGDVAVIGFAKARKLIVVTSEVRKDQHKKLHPKVPNVCEEFDVECISVIELLRCEGVKLKLEK